MHTLSTAPQAISLAPRTLPLGAGLLIHITGSLPTMFLALGAGMVVFAAINATVIAARAWSTRREPQ